MNIKNVPVDRDLAKEIFDLNDEVVAMRQVITASAEDSNNPILPDNPYHEIFVSKNGELNRKRYAFMMKYFPQLENTSASWSIDNIVPEGEQQFVRVTLPENLESAAELLKI